MIGGLGIESDPHHECDGACESIEHVLPSNGVPLPRPVREFLQPFADLRILESGHAASMEQNCRAGPGKRFEPP